jgi:hypothetical protein
MTDGTLLAFTLGSLAATREGADEAVTDGVLLALTLGDSLSRILGD